MSVKPGRRTWPPTYRQSLLEPYSLCTTFRIRNCPSPTIHHSWSWPYARHEHGTMQNVPEQMTRTRHGATRDFYRTGNKHVSNSTRRGLLFLSCSDTL